MIDLTQPLSAAPLCFVDLETTGLEARSHRVVEVFAARYEVIRGERHLTRVVNRLIDPERELDPEVVAINGIDAALLLGAPKWREVASEVEQAIEGAVFVAHNAPFDLAFLEAEQKWADRGALPEVSLCTLRASRLMFRYLRSHALGRLKDSLGLLSPTREAAPEGLGLHRAAYDAFLCRQFFMLFVLPRFEDRTLGEAVSFMGTCHGAQSVPIF